MMGTPRSADSSAPARARSVRAGSEPALDLLGWSITYLERPADNGDACGIYEGRTRSGGIVPPHREDNHEAFYILEGEFELELEGEPHRFGVGDFARIAPGVLHSVRNVGPGWGRILFVTAPGAQHVRFFQALGRPLEPGQDPDPLTAPPDFSVIEAAGQPNGIHFVPTPASS